MQRRSRRESELGPQLRFELDWTYAALRPAERGAAVTIPVDWRDEAPSAQLIPSGPDQIDDNAAASGVKLSDDVLKAIDDVLSPVL